MTTHPIPSPFVDFHEPPLPADALAREHTIAARDRVREAGAYLARMVTRYGARHPETVFAQQLLDDARIASAATYKEATR